MTSPKPLMVFEDARAQLLEAAAKVAKPASEPCQTMQACGRILAQSVRSPLNVPPHHNSAMDGYAVRIADLKRAQADIASGSVDLSAPMAISQRIPAGASPSALTPGTCARIFTGGVIPEGADAVIMQERARVNGETVQFEQPSHWAKGEAIRYAGEDIAFDSEVATAGTFLTPAMVGLIASVGISEVQVYKPITVACVFTGDELAMPGQTLKPGAIYNSNRFVLTTVLQQMGCKVIDLGHIPDQLSATREALVQAAAQADLVISSGGVSVGEEDHVKPAVQAEGALGLWQISMKPGKPLAFGHLRKPSRTQNTTANSANPPSAAIAHFVGLPGNPVSSYVTFMLLAKPFIHALQGRAVKHPLKLKMQAAFDFPKADKRREFLRATINAHGQLELYRTQSSGALTSMAYCDGLIDNPPQSPINQGDWIDFLPFALDCL
jgi:molybdopterin molybdotransferase